MNWQVLHHPVTLSESFSRLSPLSITQSKYSRLLIQPNKSHHFQSKLPHNYADQETTSFAPQSQLFERGESTQIQFSASHEWTTHALYLLCPNNDTMTGALNNDINCLQTVTICSLCSERRDGLDRSSSLSGDEKALFLSYPHLSLWCCQYAKLAIPRYVESLVRWIVSTPYRTRASILALDDRSKAGPFGSHYGAVHPSTYRVPIEKPLLPELQYFN